MKKLFKFSFVALLVIALGFAGCENTVTKGDSSAVGVERSVARKVGAPPAQWTQITDSVYTGTFGSRSVWAVNYGSIGQSSSNYAFVAGGDGGAAAYSMDGGVTWTAIPNVTNGATIYGIANDTGGRFVMVAEKATLAYTNNITSGQWTTLTGSATQMTDTIYAVAYGTRSRRFIIGGINGQAAFSTNGATWTSIPDMVPVFSPDSNIRAIASFPKASGDTFVVVGGRSGPYPMYNQAAYSVSNGDPGSWTSKSNGIFCRGLTMGAANNVPYFVASGYDMNGSSSNNITYVNATNIQSAPWTPVSVVTTGVSGWLDCIAFGGTYFVAGGVSSQISYTTDLSTWTPVKLPGFPGYVDAIAYGAITPGGGRFVAVGDSGAGAYTTNPVSETNNK
jgi:hypothetical protein